MPKFSNSLNIFQARDIVRSEHIYIIDYSQIAHFSNTLKSSAALFASTLILIYGPANSLRRQTHVLQILPLLSLVCIHSFAPCLVMRGV